MFFVCVCCDQVQFLEKTYSTRIVSYMEIFAELVHVLLVRKEILLISVVCFASPIHGFSRKSLTFCGRGREMYVEYVQANCLPEAVAFDVCMSHYFIGLQFKYSWSSE